MSVAQEVIATLMRHDLPAPAIESILSCVKDVSSNQVKQRV